MVFYIDTTGTIGQIIVGMSGFTGSLFMTLLFIFILLMIIALGFRIPIIATGIIFMPLIITLASLPGAEFMSLFAVTVIYLGIGLGELFYPN